jgi:hypothetical protein
MKEARAAEVAVKLTDKKATVAANLKIQRRKRRSRR